MESCAADYQAARTVACYKMFTTVVKTTSTEIPLSQDQFTQIQDPSMSDQAKYREKLKGDHVLVIGGSSGARYATAEAALEYGGRITISSSSPKRLNHVISALENSYSSAPSLPLHSSGRKHNLRKLSGSCSKKSAASIMSMSFSQFHVAGTEAMMTTGTIGNAAEGAEAYIYCLKDQNLTGNVISTNGGVLLTGWNQGSRK